MKRASRVLLPLACLVIGTLGCGILGLEGDVEVRVRNGSAITFDKATVFLFGEPIVETDFQPGAESPYRVVPKAYRNASSEVVVGQDTVSQTVIDHVGESKLDPGRYTYVFRVLSESPLSVTLDFKRDS